VSLRGRDPSTVLRAGRAAPGARRYLLVTAGQTTWAFPAEVTRGMVRPDDGSGGNVFSGVTHPVVDLAQHFGLTGGGEGSESSVIMCGGDQAQHAFKVDRVLGFTDLERKDLRPLPLHFAGSERSWFSGLFLYQDTLALAVDARWLVSREALPEPRLSLEPGETHTATPELVRPVSAGGSGEVRPIDEADDVEEVPWAER